MQRPRVREPHGAGDGHGGTPGSSQRAQRLTWAPFRRPQRLRVLEAEMWGRLRGTSEEFGTRIFEYVYTTGMKPREPSWKTRETTFGEP